MGKTPQAWAAIIRSDLGRTVAAIIQTAKHLEEARRDVPDGEWTRWLETEVGMSDSHARKLQAIAKHPVLTDERLSSNGDLPASIDALYGLSHLPPDVLTTLTDSGKVSGKTTISQAVALSREFHNRPTGTEKKWNSKRAAGPARAQHERAL
jgi:hypothetical protein